MRDLLNEKRGATEAGAMARRRADRRKARVKAPMSGR